MSRNIAVLVLAGFIGCQPPDEIRRYRVEKPEKPAVRLLAAVVPGGDKVWFVKLTGKPEAVEAHKSDFESFVGSMAFGGSSTVTYSVPNSWREVPGQQMLRYATFRVGPQNLELIITPLGQEAAALKPNVDRWRGQIGLPPISESELPAIARSAKLGKNDVTIIDMTGQGGDQATMVPPAPAAASKPSTNNPIQFKAPENWTEQPASGFRVAAFKIIDGNQSAECTVIPFGGPAGGLRANVNRWRSELGLPELSEADLAKNTKPLEVGGVPGVAIDFASDESKGEKRERTLGIILPRGSQTWFIKLRGPYDLVSRQRPAFDAFVASFRFADGPGGQP